ncbi:alpha/beta hydrolase [Companilactobacillus sp. DQM5]|uniref:alpha/beta hydrolase n=1 Tax=Companilactobacillus sp. DQM5 TaxID=3463359 RepID=UPI004059A99B
MKKKLRTVTISVILLFIFLLGWIIVRQNTNQKIINPGKYEPILFFHGFGSSHNAEKQMANSLVNAGITKTIIRANVEKNGKVKLLGNFNRSDYRPVVEIEFEDNKNSKSETLSNWTKNVIVKLQDKYHIEKFDMVGHSMGNMAIMFYLLNNNEKNSHLPILKKQIDIAGPFNGILARDDKPNKMKLNKDGKPNWMNDNYKKLLKLKYSYPKNQVDILNIYGNKNDGSNSDGSVSNASAMSLRYLVKNNAKTYTEKMIVGKNAQHSKLHENKEVDQLLIRFLK